MHNTVDESRRRLLRTVTLAVASIPVIGLSARVSHAAELPLVTADDPTAKALKYVDDAGKAPDAKPGSKCATCQLYQGGPNSTQGGCLLFPGKAVKAGGWCSSWTARAKS
jgi:hypothetical protein